MNQIVITKDNPLSREQFREMLMEPVENRSPIETLIALVRELMQFEMKHDMPSDLFYDRYMRGEMGDDFSFINWAGTYEIFLKTQQTIEQKLEQVAVLA